MELSDVIREIERQPKPAAHEIVAKFNELAPQTRLARHYGWKLSCGNGVASMNKYMTKHNPASVPVKNFFNLQFAFYAPWGTTFTMQNSLGEREGDYMGLPCIYTEFNMTELDPDKLMQAVQPINLKKDAEEVLPLMKTLPEADYSILEKNLPERYDLGLKEPVWVYGGQFEPLSKLQVEVSQNPEDAFYVVEKSDILKTGQNPREWKEWEIMAFRALRPLLI